MKATIKQMKGDVDYDDGNYSNFDHTARTGIDKYDDNKHNDYDNNSDNNYVNNYDNNYDDIHNIHI